MKRETVGSKITANKCKCSLVLCTHKLKLLQSKNERLGEVSDPQSLSEEIGKFIDTQSWSDKVSDPQDHNEEISEDNDSQNQIGEVSDPQNQSEETNELVYWVKEDLRLHK